MMLQKCIELRITATKNNFSISNVNNSRENRFTANQKKYIKLFLHAPKSIAFFQQLRHIMNQLILQLLELFQFYHILQ